MKLLFRNNNFEMTAPSTSDLAATSVTLTGSLTDYKSLMTEWGFQYKKATASSWTGKKVTGSTLTAELTGLSASTDYQARVYGKIGSDTQYGPVKAFKTEAAAAAE